MTPKWALALTGVLFKALGGGWGNAPVPVDVFANGDLKSG